MSQFEDVFDTAGFYVPTAVSSCMHAIIESIVYYCKYNHVWY